jgi:hypothetical protein
MRKFNYLKYNGLMAVCGPCGGVGAAWFGGPDRKSLRTSNNPKIGNNGLIFNNLKHRLAA